MNMDTDPRDSQECLAFRVAADPSPREPRRLSWRRAIWGGLIAGALGLLGQGVGQAATWATVGGLIAWRGSWIFDRLGVAHLTWCASLNPHAERETERSHQLFEQWFEADPNLRDPDGLAALLNGDQELRNLQVEHQYWVALAIPPFFGLVYGSLFGPPFGILLALVRDPSLGLSPTFGAWLGLAIGPAPVALVAGAALCWLVELDPHLPLRTRIGRRALLVASPLTIVPAVWHWVRGSARRRQAAGPTGTARA
jgi:hypothetical protein